MVGSSQPRQCVSAGRQNSGGSSRVRGGFEDRTVSAEPHNNIGTILARFGQVAEAIAHYEQALRIKLDYPEAQNNLGLALMGAGEFDAAVQHLKAAIQLNPNYGEARYNLAVILANQGKTDEAISQLESAV